MHAEPQTTTTAAIRAEGLTKVYQDPRRGVVEALTGLDLECRQGEIFGLLGPNGAGKTTTLRILATILSPTAGRATIDGVDVALDPLEARRRIGFLSASTGLYPRLTARETLTYFGRLHGIAEDALAARVDELVAAFDMGAFADGRCGSLSTGQKQRVSIARAVLHDPPVLILDEPASGLDPRARVEIKEILRELARMGKTILISSHILTELADVCSSVGIMEQGRLVASGTIPEVLARVSAQRRASIRVLADAEGARCWLEAQPDLRGVVFEEGEEGRIGFGFQGDDQRMGELVAHLSERGHRVVWVEEHKPSLETAFLSMTEGNLQ